METNGFDTKARADAYHNEVTYNIIGRVYWTDPKLAKIVRLHLLSDPGYPAWDVSYCHGQLVTGEYVEVELPFDQLNKRASIKAQIVDFARKDKVYAAGLGILGAISTLN